MQFQDGEPCTAHSVKHNFDEVQRWAAPHPPGTYLNFHPDPAVMHREFFGDDGGFRAGPTDPEFNRRFDDMVAQTDPAKARVAAEEVDLYCYEESKALFLCAPHALYAVNRHVDFKAYRATFELADTEVSEQHWSRRNGH